MGGLALQGHELVLVLPQVQFIDPLQTQYPVFDVPVESR